MSEVATITAEQLRQMEELLAEKRQLKEEEERKKAFKTNLENLKTNDTAIKNLSELGLLKEIVDASPELSMLSGEQMALSIKAKANILLSREEELRKTKEELAKRPAAVVQTDAPLNPSGQVITSQTPEFISPKKNADEFCKTCLEAGVDKGTIKFAMLLCAED